MRILFVLLGFATLVAAQATSLSENVVFVGKGKFQALATKGVAENWSELPIGERRLLSIAS